LLEDLQTRFKSSYDKVSQNVSKFTERLQDSVGSSVTFVDSALVELSEMKVVDVAYHFVLVLDESGSMDKYF